jgi:hypothetical protein
MEFIAITDHGNHVDGAVAKHTWADPEFKPDSLLLLCGAEWRTHRGLGTPLSATPYDHQKFYTARGHACRRGLQLQCGKGLPRVRDVRDIGRSAESGVDGYAFD